MNGEKQLKQLRATTGAKSLNPRCQVPQFFWFETSLKVFIVKTIAIRASEPSNLFEVSLASIRKQKIRNSVGDIQIHTPSVVYPLPRRPHAFAHRFRDP